LLWKADAGGYVPAKFAAAVLLRSSPIVVDNRVYVGSLDTNLYCLNTADGEVLWKFKTEGYITSSPAVSNGEVYVVSQESSAGGLYKLNALSGELIWKKELPYQTTAGGGTDMHASPTVANGMVFVSSNVMEYYGINATNGETIWTYRNEIAGEFIVCSTIYQNGRLFLIDKFSVTCVNASDGNVLWGTYLGDELYVSPVYADEKLYVVTDERHVYAINATNGEKLDQFEIDSNSWSAPIVYEGKLYFGSHDWNIYCLGDFSPIESVLSLELGKLKVNPKEDVVGFGSLNPGVVGARISVMLTKPDGSKSNIDVETKQDGSYEFHLTPDASGIWSAKAQWTTDKGYYASANSQEVQFEVTSLVNEANSIPFDMTYLIVIAVLVVVLVSALVYVKYRRP
jgi:outer membrane protein assembly factor BamB